MPDEVIRIGIVGAGANTIARHIPGFTAIPGVQIISVCNRSEASSARVAGQYGIPAIYRNWRELVDARDTNAIMIGVWPYMHERITVAALNAHKHVLCEARMAMNAREARTMRDTARSHPELVAQVVPSPYTLRVDGMIQRLIADGYIGDILAVEIRVGGAFLDADALLHWRHDYDLSGLNIMGLGIWYEALMRWVGDATRVMAMGKTYVHNRKDAGGRLHAVRIPEHVDVIADMACGAQAHFLVSSVAGLAGAPEAFLFGSKGTLRFSQDKLYGGQRGDASLTEIDVPASLAGGWRVEQEFIDAIRGLGIITHTTFEDGAKYMEFTEAVARSMADGRAIDLPLLDASR
ncbi:MAG: Gfo/Idh/MocA family oxidoreductase [Chloroflexi bacterium]|nr:Gfo/Idh/MocA family oxidoreductase [Chloroflexota bacterium]MCL5273608.1 Gfo/Idh/MocA family oxidoreductase [Chloroflexota bacterium]